MLKRIRDRQTTGCHVIWDGTSLNTQKCLPILTSFWTEHWSTNILRKKTEVETRHSPIRKLTNTKWRAKPTMARTSAQVLCFSAAEYACPVYCRSALAKKANISLNKTCSIVTDCMKPTRIENHHKAAGITTLDLRRKPHDEQSEKLIATFDVRPIIFGPECGPSRLKFRRRFLRHALDEPAFHYPLRVEPSNG